MSSVRSSSFPSGAIGKVAGLFAAASGVALSTTGEAKAAMFFNIFQDSQGVQILASGDFKFGGTPFLGSGRLDPFILPLASEIIVGQGGVSQGSWNQLFVPITSGPASAIGSGTGAAPNVYSGDTFGFAGPSGSSSATFIFPVGYVSGTTLSATTIYNGQTLASLGLTAGNYVWTTNSNGVTDTVRLTVSERVPAPLPLFGAAASFAWSRRLRSRLNHRSLASTKNL